MANESIKLFETQKVNVYWDNELEEWYFCINDVIEILTDSVDPAEYFKKLRKRDPELDTFVRGTNCPPPTNSVRQMENCMLKDVSTPRILCASFSLFPVKQRNLSRCG